MVIRAQMTKSGRSRPILAKLTGWSWEARRLKMSVIRVHITDSGRSWRYLLRKMNGHDSWEVPTEVGGHVQYLWSWLMVLIDGRSFEYKPDGSKCQIWTPSRMKYATVHFHPFTASTLNPTQSKIRKISKIYLFWRLFLDWFLFHNRKQHWNVSKQE